MCRDAYSEWKDIDNKDLKEVLKYYNRNQINAKQIEEMFEKDI